MLGYTPEEWREGKLWPKRLHPGDRERILAADERFEAGARSPLAKSTVYWRGTGRWCGSVRRRFS